MANWIPISYAVIGSKEEREDLFSKIRKCEQMAREKKDNEFGAVDLGDLAKLLGSDVKGSDLMGYWHYPDGDRDSVEQKTTEDGETYFTWLIVNKNWENPKVRDVIEGAYKTIKILYDAPAGDTNDKESRYFQPMVRLTNIDGLNYQLKDNGTAMLNCDDSIKCKVLKVPEQVEYAGKKYVVDSFGDCFADPQYGSPTKAPEELEEIYFPVSIKRIAEFGVALPSLQAIHFAGDINIVGEEAFSCCNKLSTVEFGGKVGSIESAAFGSTEITDIDIPDGTRVDPRAFEDAPFGNRKSMTINIRDIQSDKGSSDIVKFLREMQYRMNIRILIDNPYFSHCAVEFENCQKKLNDNTCWIYDNLGDELLRNTVIADWDTILAVENKSDVRLECYNGKFYINVTIDSEHCVNEDFNSAEELKSHLLNLDNNIEKYKDKIKEDPEAYELPF